ncbi:glutamate--cysteine ligase [Candidatus Tachikawaea gelatinosa]|uniref:Glutamate--cysteine ligase n=1 Tax=Candidatus Tachikawaea gelatinosa TaxID=1410383 RepID=A0A090ASJ2_9ENTR|nr:glutamate--cysteine ligase [Candidatus Tachikawaea gelatinosa]BAP58850.1 glutamate--cysteine ligase [Candidatus Tachikawaea gelatinosa]
MIKNFSKILTWMKKNSQIFNIKKGIERETLRVNFDGRLSNKIHPKTLGSPLKNKWITTDFAESLLEFITPVCDNTDKMIAILSDIHRYVIHELDQELMWPLSIPCIIDDINHIKIANYGKSNVGRIKTLYRKGLKHRYGPLMQTIAGLHYNFSLSLDFWNEWAIFNKQKNKKKFISSGYFDLIRNYYRFGWIIVYLFGSSPAISSSFLNKRNGNQDIFKFHQNHKSKNTLWMPYATSLRLSNLGYTNNTNNISFLYNSLKEYNQTLYQAIKTPSQKYIKIGIKDSRNNLLQLNTNILQTVNELYVPIRPKKITYPYEEKSPNVFNIQDVEYLEIRSLDINPFSSIGIDIDQVLFLDLFLIWCLLKESPKINKKELFFIKKNWERIILEGRKPKQTIHFLEENNSIKKYFLDDFGKDILTNLQFLAEILDNNTKSNKYQKACQSFMHFFNDPDLTYSGRILKIIKKNGFQNTGLYLAKKHFNSLKKEKFEIYSKEDFIKEAKQSIFLQKELEENDNTDFKTYLKKWYNNFI